MRQLLITAWCLAVCAQGLEPEHKPSSIVEVVASGAIEEKEALSARRGEIGSAPSKAALLRRQSHVMSEKKRMDCKRRSVVSECPSAKEGKEKCENSMVVAGTTAWSPCLFTALDAKANTPDTCKVDTYDPCYDTYPYDEGRSPGQWPEH
eukprot:TRINITY_DN72939_c0_g1_i1.p1 TRINITY_DN72939_c0_g1~~TRINITY_DN72939_c0_g1_i1.p1  ORF type:complete len:150 (+),score=25.72 TRINITY_DN72939_c0_g1_i1:93-542(+)